MEKEKKKADPFMLTWDLAVWVSLYALLLLAIFGGISYLMIWGLEQVALGAGHLGLNELDLLSRGFYA